MAITKDELVEFAPIGLEQRKANIELMIAELRDKLGDGSVGDGASPQVRFVSTYTGSSSTRKPMSAAARGRVAAAQRKRWAAYRAVRAQKSASG